MKPLMFVLLVVALHVGIASVAASRHLIDAGFELPLIACDASR